MKEGRNAKIKDRKKKNGVEKRKREVRISSNVGKFVSECITNAAN